MMKMYLDDHHQYKNHVQNLVMVMMKMNLVIIEKRIIQENKIDIQNNVMIEIMTMMMMILIIIQVDEHHHQHVKQLLVILHIDLVQKLMEMLMMIWDEQTE